MEDQQVVEELVARGAFEVVGHAEHFRPLKVVLIELQDADGQESRIGIYTDELNDLLKGKKHSARVFASIWKPVWAPPVPAYIRAQIVAIDKHD